jgi:hypothetical protein
MSEATTGSLWLVWVYPSPVQRGRSSGLRHADACRTTARRQEAKGFGLAGKVVGLGRAGKGWAKVAVLARWQAGKWQAGRGWARG